jgi:hypothetical protein
MFRVLFGEVTWQRNLNSTQGAGTKRFLQDEEAAFLGKGEAGVRVEGGVGDNASAEAGVCRGGNHSCVIGIHGVRAPQVPDAATLAFHKFLPIN